MSIYGLKLISGEEVFATVQQDSSGRYILTNSVSIRMMPSRIQGSEPQMAFVPFPSFSDPEKKLAVAIDPVHVVYLYTPADDIVENYKTMFTQEPASKIVT
jgi:hypothetical protein